MQEDRMDADGKPGIKSEINVTPLVDVVLVLLIVFMVIMPVMVTQGIQLPKTQNKSVPPGDRSKTISMTREGMLYFEQEVVSEELLAQRLKSLQARNPEAQVILRADRSLTYGRVHHILDLATTAGFRNLALLADPGPSPAPAK
jgi:biopolymer transport protein TolR